MDFSFRFDNFFKVVKSEFKMDFSFRFDNFFKVVKSEFKYE